MELAVIIIGIAGSVASIIGAILAIQAEKKAKSAAEQAELAKNAVIKKQKTTNLAEILFEAKRVQKIFGKYSIAQSNRSLAGVEFAKDSETLQEYVFSFNENRQLVEETTEIETQAVYDELNKLLTNFSEAKAVGDKKDFGNQIRLAIDDIIFKIRKEIDDRNSKIE
ncbi:hypothetical protein EZY14_009565 [Kordia sp. TARA_039_SRF]|nr:hypothetical protein EZY14_009565 [Kordia sp. TARA_039_SRF]